VKEIAPLADAVAALQPGGVLLAAVAGATEALTAVRVDPAVPVAIAIGPEGGFDGAELDHLRAAGAAEAHLGPRIVRSRLAGAIATSVLLALCGDLSGGPAREERA
jgi:16S rRNA (uracil1498-N3)-methyltransferase